MKLRPLGGSGLKVSEVGLGALPLSLAGRPSEAEAIRVVHAALDAGMTWIDTADVYCLDDGDLHHSERLLAKALRGRQALVATKGGCGRPGGDWVSRARPDQLRRACEGSLRALGVDRIDLYQLHAPDDQVPFADSVGELARLRAEGKIAHVGLSNVSAEQVEEALTIVPVVSVQNRANVRDRTAWHDGVLATCERHGLAFIAYSPVGGAEEHAALGRDSRLRRIAAAHGATPWEVALAWLLAQSPAMLVIPGASRVESARSSARAAELRLTAAELAELG